MPSSMTGYGKAQTTFNNYEIEVEIRSLNNRYLDTIIRLPKSLENYEQLIKDEIKKKLIRGKISISISINGKLNGHDGFKLNEDSLQYYYNLLNEMKAKTGAKGDITLDHLLQFKDLLQPNDEDFDDVEIKENVLITVNEALDKLINMRVAEAENIGKDVNNRLRTIEKITEDIYQKGKQNPKQEYDKLYQRVELLLQGKTVDENRLEMEISLLADRVDVTEECTRLKSHIQQFNTIFENRSEVGKPLTFILQEMHREVNTIGSKTTNVEISHSVIKMKEEIEKLREQIQNLE
ncbi:YicC/YloC family endoribonuclease [Calditrichota bacterium]